jgi:hypothetical protein
MLLVSEYVNGHHHHRNLRNRLLDEWKGEKGRDVVAFFSLDVITRILIDCDSPCNGTFEISAND